MKTSKLIVKVAVNTALAISRDDYDSEMLDQLLLPGTTIHSLLEDYPDLEDLITDLLSAIMSEFMMNGDPDIMILENK